ncbi:MAG: hypothetical protein IT364_02985 [Candidatus Hydrogenedentes bacterium]|nr:hypothetical protein [Candidatus Hydrogenedentota bacterium]
MTGALRRARWILIGLASITVGLILISYKWDETAGPRASLAVSFALVAACVVLLFYCVVMLLFSLLRSKQILLNDILGAVSLYLVFGYIWAFVYTSMELLHPGSFDGLEVPITGTTDRLSATFSRLSYFSFITLATQGYGDVTPRTAWAETFVMLQTIVGQLYVALVLAYLLSVHLNSNRNAEQQ